MSDVRVEGLAELRKLLVHTLPDRLQGKALQGALAKAAQPIVQQARALVPVDTGRLRQAIYSKRSRYSKPQREARIITVRRGKKQQKRNRDAYYWKFVEFGHRVGNKKTGYLRKQGASSGGFSGPTKFVPARPFMRPAFETNKMKAIEIVRQELANEIKKVAVREQSRLGRMLRRRAIGF